MIASRIQVLVVKYVALNTVDSGVGASVPDPLKGFTSQTLAATAAQCRTLARVSVWSALDVLDHLSCFDLSQKRSVVSMLSRTVKVPLPPADFFMGPLHLPHFSTQLILFRPSVRHRRTSTQFNTTRRCASVFVIQRIFLHYK